IWSHIRTLYNVNSKVSYCYDVFFCSSRRRHTRFSRDWSSDVCSSDLLLTGITHWAAAALAVITVLVIRRIGMLLSPERPLGGKRLQVVAVRSDAAAPPLRAVRP